MSTPSTITAIGPRKRALRHVGGCPNTDLARARLVEALRRVGRDPTAITVADVANPQDAERLGFRGSPAILIGGRDSFADRKRPDTPTCRIDQAETGTHGSATVARLEAVLRR